MTASTIDRPTWPPRFEATAKAYEALGLPVPADIDDEPVPA